MTVRVDDSRVAAVEDIMRRHGRVDLASRQKTYHDGGWTKFDEYGPPYTPGEIAQGRALHVECPRIWQRELAKTVVLTDDPVAAGIVRHHVSGGRNEAG